MSRDGGCYLYVDEEMNYYDAKAFCQNKMVNGRRGHLFEPKTDAINKYIYYQSRYQIEGNSYWIGVNDIDIEDNWVYSSSGLPATTTFFLPGAKSL